MVAFIVGSTLSAMLLILSPYFKALEKPSHVPSAAGLATYALLFSLIFAALGLGVFAYFFYHHKKLSERLRNVDLSLKES